MEYFNGPELRARGVDPVPMVGDVVEWVSNGEEWTVAEEDLIGDVSINSWPDGPDTWWLIRMLRRGAFEFVIGGEWPVDPKTGEMLPRVSDG